MKKALSLRENTQNRFAGKFIKDLMMYGKIYSYQMELGRLRDAFSKEPDKHTCNRCSKHY